MNAHKVSAIAAVMPPIIPFPVPYPFRANSPKLPVSMKNRPMTPIRPGHELQDGGDQLHRSGLLHPHALMSVRSQIVPIAVT